MTEQRESYEIATKSPAPNMVTCQRCGEELGLLIGTADRVLLQVGHLYVTHLDGVCQCGAPYHWSATSQKLDRLIARMTAARAAV